MKRFKLGFASRMANAIGAIALAFASVFATSDIAFAANACDPNIDVSGSTYFIKFTNNTACEWTVPEGIYVDAKVVLAGGGGAGGSGPYAGGGGGGQVLYRSDWSMNPGTVVTITVGNGGSHPGSTNAQGGAGGVTSFVYNSTTVRARGGGGGGGSDQNWKSDASQNPSGGNGGSGGGGNVFSGNTRGLNSGYYNAGWTSYGHAGGIGEGGSQGYPANWGAGAGGGGAYSTAGDTKIVYGQAPTSYHTTIGRAGAGVWLLGECLAGGGDSRYVPEDSSIKATNEHDWLYPPSGVECRKTDGTVVDGSYSGGFGNTAPATNSGGGSAGSSGDNGADGIVMLTYTLDPPNITKADIAKTGTSATFTFSGTMTGDYTCWLDGDSTSPCSSPITYDNLSKGGHTFEVAQKDSFGVRSAKTTKDFGLYPVAPTMVIMPNSQDTEVVADNITNKNTPYVQASSLMVDAHVVIRAVDSDGNKESCSFTATAVTQGCEISKMSDGVWTLEAYQELPTNYESAVKKGEVITIDTRSLDAPNITSEIPAIGANQPIFQFSGSANARRYLCSLDDATPVACTSPYKLRVNNGNHEFKVTQVDIAGNISDAASQSFTTLVNVGPVPTEEPTPEPTPEPSVVPTQDPTPEPTKEPDPTQEPTPEPTETATPEPTVTTDSTPSAQPSPLVTAASLQNFGKAVQNLAIGATGDDNAPPQKFDPMSSPEGVKAVTSTVTKAVTLVSSVAAAAAGAAAGAAAAGAGAAGAAGGASAGSSAGSSAGGVSTNTTSMEGVDGSDSSGGDTGDLEQMEIKQDDLMLDPNFKGLGDNLAIASVAWFSMLDRPSHELVEKTSRYSPLMSKIFNDGTYLRASFGIFSLLLPLAGLILGFVSIGSSPFGVLTPQWQLMLAMSILGIFDASAGFIASLVYLIGTIATHDGLLDINDWRLLMGVLLVSMGPSLVTTTFRKLRKPSAHGDKDWWERLSDLAIAPFMASWVSGAMVASMPALAGVTLAVANHVNDYSLALGFAIFVRVWFEEGVARFFPWRINRINPDEIESPPLIQRYIALSIKFGLWILVSGALVGVSWHIFVGAFITLAPTILTWYEDRFPNYPWLWRILPIGIPGLALSLGVASVMGIVAAAIFGASPELAQWSFVILPIPLMIINVAGSFGRHDGTGREEKPVKKLIWVYRVGGIIMLAITLKLAGIY